MTPRSDSLGERLRALRVDRRLTQQSLATALGVSTPSISSWESGTSVPTPERLRDYALAFAAADTFSGPEPRLVDESDLSRDEDRQRQALIDELVGLRDQSSRAEGTPAPGTGALGGRFWYFPGGSPIRIISTPTWPSLRDGIPYADPWHPNYVQSFTDMDRDATLELYGHIRAENPTAEVKVLTADGVTDDDLTGGHLVLLGQGDQMPVNIQAPLPEGSEYVPGPMAYFIRRLELPVGTRVPPGGNGEFDSEFVVTVNGDDQPEWYQPGQSPAGLDVFRPRFLRDEQGGRGRLVEHDVPLLEYDVALLARKQNQLNLSVSVTICSGIFSRGTYGAVRALTDPNLRTRNEAFLSRRFGDMSNFWHLLYVPIFRSGNGLTTITPDLERPFHRLRSSM